MENIQNGNIQNLFPWINIEFCENILRKVFPHSKCITVLNYTLKPALKLGENYTSEMIRVTVNYVINNNINTETHQCDNKFNFIIKTKLCNEQLKLELDKLNYFEKEIIMYRDILPAVQNLFLDIDDNNLQFSAKCYETKDDADKSYLVLEDLSVKGFKNIDRRYGLDMEHFSKTLEKLAKFHAASAVLESKNQLPRKMFNESSISENNETSKKMFTTSYQTIAQYTKITPGFEKINANLERVLDKIYDKICSIVKRRDDSGFNALLHGDLWSNNMMFAYNTDDSLFDAIMVDYQDGYWGSIGLDLAYALFSSSHESLCDHDWDYLLNDYHKVLSETLKKLEYPKAIPLLSDIHGEFLRCGVVYAGFGMVLHGIRRLENVEDDVMSAFIDDTEENRLYRLDLLKRPDMQNVLKFLLHFYDRKGFFD